MSEYMIIGLIVVLAAAYLGYKFFGKKNRGGCGCGCSGCSVSSGAKTGSGSASGGPGNESCCCGSRAGDEK